MSLGFIVYNDMHKLWACLVVAKEDPSVFFDPVAPLVDNSLVQTLLEDNSIKFELTKLMELYMKEKTDCG